MGSTPRHRRIRWRTKHYLPVAMVGALVVIALVAAISICLAPAHLTYKIAAANIAVLPFGNNQSNTHLDFILEVNNTSPRMAVWYGHMTGEISYGPAATAWVRYGSGGKHGWHQPLSNVIISLSADYGYNQTTPFAVDSCRILMVSKVWFAWHGLPTLPYTLRFSCEPVDFNYNKGFPVTCA